MIHMYVISSFFFSLINSTQLILQIAGYYLSSETNEMKERCIVNQRINVRIYTPATATRIYRDMLAQPRPFFCKDKLFLLYDIFDYGELFSAT